MVSMGRIEQLFSVAYYLGASAFFLFISLDQTAFDNFLYFFLFPFFLIEYVSLHSSIFIVGEIYSAKQGGIRFFSEKRLTKEAKELIKIVLFYVVFAGAAAFLARNPLIVGHFVFSSASKIFSLKNAPHHEQSFAFKKAAFTLFIFVTAISAGLIALPADSQLSWEELAKIAGEKEPQVTGSPPGGLAAGLFLYFLLLAVTEFHSEKTNNFIKKLPVLEKH